MNTRGRSGSAGARNGRKARLPDGSVVYAIGDLHGCHGLMRQALKLLATDIAKRAAKRTSVVFLGDYIDRGDDSAAIIEDLSGWDAGSPPPGLEEAQPIFLKGNHEELMLNALDSRGSVGSLMNWLANGGVKTLDSYQAGSVDELADSMPRRHLEFLRSLRLYHAEGGYLFAHAGLRPGIPLESQNPFDLIWIREPFLDSDTDHGYCVVHGHTPCNEPQNRGNRIGIDTGAFYTGALTLLALEGSSVRFLQARADPVVRQKFPAGRQKQ